LLMARLDLPPPFELPSDPAASSKHDLSSDESELDTVPGSTGLTSPSTPAPEYLLRKRRRKRRKLPTGLVGEKASTTKPGAKKPVPAQSTSLTATITEVFEDVRTANPAKRTIEIKVMEHSTRPESEREDDEPSAESGQFGVIDRSAV